MTAVRTKKRTTRRLSRDQRRAQLLAATEKVIERDGLQAATMEGVAAAAKVSKPVLYSHFEHRAALLLALLEEYWAQIDEAVSERLHGASDIDGHIEAIVEGVFEAMEAGGPVMQLLWNENSQEALVEEARTRRQRDTEARWSGTYQQKYGLSKPVADCAAAMVRAAIGESTAHWLRTSNAKRAACSSTCITFVRAGLVALKTEPSRNSSRR